MSIVTDPAAVSILLARCGESSHADRVRVCTHHSNGFTGENHQWRRPGTGEPANAAEADRAGQRLGERAESRRRTLVEREDPAHGGMRAAAPVLTAEGAIGYLLADFSDDPGLSSSALGWLLESYAAAVGLCVGDPEGFGCLVAGSRVDALTGCRNRAGVLEFLEEEISRADRATRPFCVAFLDLDNFREVNERYGHLAGDLILAAIGKGLEECMRACDAVGRIGGDEFVAILPGTTISDAARLAARLEAVVTEVAERVGQPGLGVSIGVAQHRLGGDAEAVLARADMALSDVKARRKVDA